MSRFALLRVATLPFETLAPLSAAGEATTLARTVLAVEKAVDEESIRLSERLFLCAGTGESNPDAARARFAVLALRRTVHGRLAPRPADVARAQALLGPELASRLDAFARRLRGRDEIRAGFAQTWRRTENDAWRSLTDITGVPMVEHGMYLSSRSLVPKVARLRSRDPEDWGHAERHAAAKAAAFVARFTTKTSPNGVFCAVAPAVFHDGPATVGGRGGPRRTEVLLSLSEVRKVVACLAVDPQVAEAVVPRPNPTLRESEGHWTWWNPASPRHPTDEEVHSRAKDQPVLRLFVAEAAREHSGCASLVDAVAARTGIAATDLASFLARLIERGILIGEVEVPWSSRRRFRDLASTVTRRGAHADWVEKLERIETEVDSIASMPFEARGPAMDAVSREVEALPRRRPFRGDELFRVDSAAAFDVCLPESLFAELAEAMARYSSMLAAMYPEEAAHRRFMQRFLHHHAPDVDVPFLDVYGRLAEGPADEHPPKEFPEPPAANPRARRIYEWFVERASAAAPGEEVECDFAAAVPQPRWAAGVLFQVAARDVEEVAAGRGRIVLNAVFNGVGLALSRFAHLLQGGSTEGAVVHELRRAWSHFERPGAVLAELTFNHEARTANAGLRPVLFGREIELPGDLVSPGVERFSLSDLILRYDSAIDRLVLRSLERGVEVIPVVSSGVSPSGIVSALILLGRQGLQSVGHLPGFHHPSVVRWPRFTLGRVVLFRARWVFRGDDLPFVRRAGGTPAGADVFLEAAAWRERHGLPRHVFVHTTAEPKPYYVDLDSPVFLDLLRRTASTSRERAGSSLVVTEMLPGPGELWLRDQAGAYAGEFLVQMEGSDRAPGALVRSGADARLAGARP